MAALPAPSASADCTEPVTIVRMEGEREMERLQLRLLQCDGTPNPVALEELSVLARDHRSDAPDPERDRDDSGRLIPGRVHQLHPGLVTRLAAMARRFENREIQIVSGHRARSRRSSRHHSGRALDIRVVGIDRNVVSEFARTLRGTGVGFYPNSTFTHIDVRERSYYWVDQSAPGERARYQRLSDEERFSENVGRDASQATSATTAATIPATGESPVESPGGPATRTQDSRVAARSHHYSPQLGRARAPGIDWGLEFSSRLESVASSTPAGSEDEAPSTSATPAEAPLSGAEARALRESLLTQIREGAAQR